MRSPFSNHARTIRFRWAILSAMLLGTLGQASAEEVHALPRAIPTAEPVDRWLSPYAPPEQVALNPAKARNAGIYMRSYSPIRDDDRPWLRQPPPGAVRSTPGASNLDRPWPPRGEEFVLEPIDAAERIIDLPQDIRPSVYQGVGIETTWLVPAGTSGLGLTSIDLQAHFALPFFRVETPLVITPGFGAHVIDSPASYPDLPPDAYEGYIDFTHLRKLTDTVGMNLGVTIGWYSDFEQSSSDALRIMGRGMLAWDINPHWKAIGGVVYLDREDIPILPAAGLIWRPNNLWRHELIFPKPKIARRTYLFRGDTDDLQDWFYFSAELGGGSWAVRRASGLDDIVTYRDYRVILGLERLALGAPDLAAEIGYVFSREIEFESGSPKSHPDDTVLLRLIFTY